MPHVIRFLADESGATAIEYGLIAASIALTLRSTVKNVGSNPKTSFNTIAANVR